MIFLGSRERIWDSPGNPKQIWSSPFHSCIHQIISPRTVRLSVVIEWLIPLYAFACLRCCSPLLRTSFPCSCLFFFLIAVWGVWCWHCSWSSCRLCICQHRAWLGPWWTSYQLPQNRRWWRDTREHIRLLGFPEWAYRTMHTSVGLDWT